MTTSPETPVRLAAGLVCPALGDSRLISPIRISESEGLVEALDVDLAFTIQFRVRTPNAGQLMGDGQIQAVIDEIDNGSVDLVVMDCSLTPVQQRNLERKLGTKVVDRTGLILEIFGLRARTAEGSLQVEMARLLYERSRLVRTWTHLERQRGGRGFLAGPGESQLESDRRMLDRQIGRLKASIEDVRRTRGLQRAGRRRRGKPIVALVGYTNAGKSTLFNRLTDESVFSADMPFATLDPTIREFGLPSGDSVSLVDTVGFITDLPTTLVDSFQATIEEAMEADVLLHVRDISDEESDRQAEDVMSVLRQLEESTGSELPPILEVWNKIDALDDDLSELARVRATHREDAVCVSALTGEGLHQLLEMIQLSAFDARIKSRIAIKAEDGKARAWLYERGEVLDESYDESGRLMLSVLIDRVEVNRFRELFEQYEDHIH